MKITIISIAALMILSAVFFVFFNPFEVPNDFPTPRVTSSASPVVTKTAIPTIKSTATPSSTIRPTATPTPTSTPAGPVTFTLAQIAQHSNKSSCWSTIENKVYDLTTWISQHPGGEQNILSICGKDGTSAFTAQHDHRQQQQNILAGFLIGNLSP